MDQLALVAEEFSGYLKAGGNRRPDALRACGARVATTGVPMSAVVDACLQEAGRVPHADLEAVRLALKAVCTGYEDAQREALRSFDTERRGFVEDLLRGRAEPSIVSRFGLRPASDYVVAVARRRPPYEVAESRRIEEAMISRFGSHNILVTAREGLLVCVAPGTLDAAIGEFTRHVRQVTSQEWRVGVGRPQRGQRGIAGSYQEAREALSLGDRLQLPGPVLRAADLLVFPVLLRDRVAIEDLVTAVLGPLRTARGGAGPLLATLEAIFATRGNNAAAARRLEISVRAVTYRLERIRRLTGYSPTDPTQRFTLETAVLGARLLGWPG